MATKLNIDTLPKSIVKLVPGSGGRAVVAAVLMFPSAMACRSCRPPETVQFPRDGTPPGMADPLLVYTGPLHPASTVTSHNVMARQARRKMIPAFMRFNPVPWNHNRHKPGHLPGDSSVNGRFGG